MDFPAYPLLGPVPAAPGAWSWPELMRLCQNAARSAALADEVPVGALVVDPQGQILSSAANSVERLRDPSAHAEILAIRQAAQKLRNYRLNDCVMVVTLEPCSMCAGAIVHSRIRGVVYGASNPGWGALISQQDVLLQPGLTQGFWFMGGVCGVECANLLGDFFERMR